jgi:hypothetical protein
VLICLEGGAEEFHRGLAPFASLKGIVSVEAEFWNFRGRQRKEYLATFQGVLDKLSALFPNLRTVFIRSMYNKRDVWRLLGTWQCREQVDPSTDMDILLDREGL